MVRGHKLSCSTVTWGLQLGNTTPSSCSVFPLCCYSMSAILVKIEPKLNVENQAVCRWCNFPIAITQCNQYLLQNYKLKQKKVLNTSWSCTNGQRNKQKISLRLKAEVYQQVLELFAVSNCSFLFWWSLLFWLLSSWKAHGKQQTF